MKKLVQGLLVLLVALALGMSYRIGKTSVPIPKPIVLPPKTVEVPVEPKGVIISVTMKDLEARLIANSTHLSSKQRKAILDAIEKTSEVYNVSPLILFSIARVESSFRAWVTHKQVIINKKKDNAIGLTAIVYSWWGAKLKAAGIIETRSDLYDPQLNILACGFIFNELRKLPLKKGTTDPNISAMRRYFGANFKSYSDKIEAEIGAIVFGKVYNVKRKTK